MGGDWEASLFKNDAFFVEIDPLRRLSFIRLFFIRADVHNWINIIGFVWRFSNRYSARVQIWQTIRILIEV